MASLVEGITGLEDPASSPPCPRSRSLSTRLTPECGVLLAGPRVTGARKRAVSWAPEVLENKAKTKCKSDAEPTVADGLHNANTGGPPPPPPPPPPSPLSQSDSTIEDSADRRKNRRMRIQKQHRDITTEAERGQPKNLNVAPPPSPTRKQEEVQKANMKFNTYYQIDISQKTPPQGATDGELRRRSAPLPGAYKLPCTMCVSCHQNSAADQITRLERLQKLLVTGQVPKAIQLISDELALLRLPHISLQLEPHEITPPTAAISTSSNPPNRCETGKDAGMEFMNEFTGVQPTAPSSVNTGSCILLETLHPQSIPQQVDSDTLNKTPMSQENSSGASVNEHRNVPTPTIVITPIDTPCDKPHMEFTFETPPPCEESAVLPTDQQDAPNTPTPDIPPVIEIPPLHADTKDQPPPIRIASVAFGAETVMLEPPAVAKIPEHVDEDEEERERKTLELHELAEVMAAAHSNSRRRRRQRGGGDA